MPNVSSQGGDRKKNSGHGAFGMGGDPGDLPRDLDSGREGLMEDDRGSGTGPVPGAFGGHYDQDNSGSAGNETVGPMGDKGIHGDIGK